MKKTILALFLTFLFLLPMSSYAAPLQNVLTDNESEYQIMTQPLWNWINTHFHFKSGSGLDPGNVNTQWYTYTDIWTLGSNAEATLLFDWANSVGINPEAVLLHSKIDYTGNVATPWAVNDEFDGFEGHNGVLTETGGTFTDNTTWAYSGASPYVTVDKNLYIGYEYPFDQANFVIRTAAVSLAGTWQYWNGTTWTTLAVTDGTSGLTTSGQLYFVPPSNWARTILNGSRNKYFIRFLYSSAVTPPAISTIKGDSWTNGSAKALRGWSFTDPNRINVGTEREYNPTPPAGSSAHFEYQARVAGGWGAQHYAGDPADFQLIEGTSTRTWAAFRSNLIYQMYLGHPAMDGVMCDDGAVIPTVSNIGVDWTNTDFVDKSTDTFTNVGAAKYGDIVKDVHALIPGFKVGINAVSFSLSYLGDFNLSEGYIPAYSTSYSPILVYPGGGNLTMDSYLPVNNPTGIKGLLIFSDSLASGPIFDIWDKANRGPMCALSEFLIGWNSNVFFEYSSMGTIYAYLDDVFLKDGTRAHMAVTGVPALNTVKNWTTWFPAMDIDYGTPTTDHNLTWKSWSDVTAVGGSESSGVWRRDYTNCIVLYRPGYYNSTVTEYTTPSNPIALGGTYYLLAADGSTGPAITTIQLRTQEGAILMKAPLGSVENIGGSVSGLSGSIVLQDNGADNLNVSSNGNFTFATALNDGTNYAVSVLTQPTGQTCTVTNGSGTLSGADVTNVGVTCTNNPTYSIGGNLSGLSGSVTLENNGVDDLTLTADGSFAFTTQLYTDDTYAVTVSSQPANQTCVVTSGTGTVASANVTNVAVTCVDGTDTTPPTVDSFSLPTTQDSLTVSITLTASDNIAVTEYCLTETNDASTCSWDTFAHTTYTFSSEGSKTLYAFAKDAASNVSTSRSATTTIALATPNPTPTPNTNSKSVISAIKIKIGDELQKVKNKIISWEKSFKLQGNSDSLANGQVKIYQGSKKIKTVDVGSDGKWSKNLQLDDGFSGTIKLKYFNQSGNELNSDKFKLQIDTQKPTFDQPFPISLTKGRPDRIYFDATDDNLRYYKVKLLDAQGHIQKNWRQQNEAEYYVPVDVPNGNYIFIARAYDKAGNYAEEQTELKVVARK